MPKDCMTAKSPHLLCDGCGRPATHMPVRLRGWFCAECCPACRPRGQDVAGQTTRSEVEHGSQTEGVQRHDAG
jgi:hypothetical protein